MKRLTLLFATALLLTLAASGCGLLREVEAPSATLESAPLAATATLSDAASGDAAAESSAPQVFEIIPGESSVTFELDEELRGVPTTVVGVTDQVAGKMAVDPSSLVATQVGEIRINARTLATDNNFRNRAINNEILDTGAHEFITFVPTAIEGLPASAAEGEAVSFTITGDLTIRAITQRVTFDVTATLVSAGEIRGTATTTVARADFDLRIPEVPSVANVEEEVELTIEFIARS